MRSNAITARGAHSPSVCALDPDWLSHETPPPPAAAAPAGLPAAVLLRGGQGGSLGVAQDLTEDEETVEDSVIEDEEASI